MKSNGSQLAALAQDQDVGEAFVVRERGARDLPSRIAFVARVVA